MTVVLLGKSGCQEKYNRLHCFEWAHFSRTCVAHVYVTKNLKFYNITFYTKHFYNHSFCLRKWITCFTGNYIAILLSRSKNSAMHQLPTYFLQLQRLFSLALLMHFKYRACTKYLFIQPTVHTLSTNWVHMKEKYSMQESWLKISRIKVCTIIVECAMTFNLLHSKKYCKHNAYLPLKTSCYRQKF